MPVLAACHLIYICSIVLHYIAIHVVANKVLSLSLGSKSAISLQRGPVDPEFQVKEVAPTNPSSSHITRLNDLLYGIKIWTDLSSVLSQCTR